MLRVCKVLQKGLNSCVTCVRSYQSHIVYVHFLSFIISCTYILLKNATNERVRFTQVNTFNFTPYLLFQLRAILGYLRLTQFSFNLLLKCRHSTLLYCAPNDNIFLFLYTFTQVVLIIILLIIYKTTPNLPLACSHLHLYSTTMGCTYFSEIIWQNQTTLLASF